MSGKETWVASSPEAAKPKVQRARSVPAARPFRVATFYWSLCCLCLMVSATSLAMIFLRPHQLAPWVMAGGLVMSGATFLISVLHRRAAKCPLCKGTPLIGSGAMPHHRARRIRPFNHGASAMLSIMVTQKFHCMYCSAHYDLRKSRSRESYVDVPD